MNDISTMLAELGVKVSSPWSGYLQTAITIILTIVVAKLATVLVKRMTRRFTRKVEKEANADKLRKAKTTASALNNVIKYAIWLLAGAAILGELGLSATMNAVFATVGIGGLAVAFSAQSLIKDVTVGMFMLFEDQLSVGDFVKIGDVTGTVESISLRTTQVRGASGELTVIPNGIVDKTVNYSRGSYTLPLDMDIAYEADIQRAADIMLSEVKAYSEDREGVVTGEPVYMGVSAMKASAVTLRVGVPVKPQLQGAVQRELTQSIKLRFDSESIEIPYNKLVLYNGSNGNSGNGDSRNGNSRNAEDGEA